MSYKPRQSLSRRDFLKLAGIASGELALTACGLRSPNLSQTQKEETTPIALENIQLTQQNIEFATADGKTITNSGFFVPMKEVQVENGSLWVPQDDTLGARLAQLHTQFPPEQQTVWQQKTNAIVEATAGDAQQNHVLLQLWGPNTPPGEWTTLLNPGDSVSGKDLNGTGFAYPTGWDYQSVVADMLVGVARRARFTQIANVSTPITMGRPGATGIIGLDQVVQNGWLAKR